AATGRPDIFRVLSDRAAAWPLGGLECNAPPLTTGRPLTGVARLPAVEQPGADRNVHAAWRMAMAKRIAGTYAGNPNVAALAVAGSVGAGLADRFSALELDCYWFRPPVDADRLGPVAAMGGSLLALWDFDEDDEEWSEDYRVGELDITVSNFLVG